MEANSRRIVIIGGGIAGLCTAVYAQRHGYQAEVLEMHDSAGGLATSWHRHGYIFETCLHWLLGSNPESPFHAQWKEIFDIDRLKFVHREEFVRLERENGQYLRIYTDLGLLEKEFLRRAPKEKKEIQDFILAVRRLSTFALPDPAKGWIGNWQAMLKDLPQLPLFHRLSKMTSAQYGERFEDSMLRAFFQDGDSAKMSALALFFSLAWMHNRDADYPVGGAQAVIRLIVQNLTSLGGKLRCGAKVVKIVVEDDIAVGVQLSTGELVRGDWIVSAADGHETIYGMLEGRYGDHKINDIYRNLETFSSYAQVSFGIARDLSNEPGFLIRILDEPFAVDPDSSLSQLSFRIFNFDPTFAPAGKTAVTCFLPTRNFEYWTHLQQEDNARYQQEKQRLAKNTLTILEKRIPGVSQAVEVVDVSTPASVIRYTGNWKGSMEGWLLTPETGYHALPGTLPGLSRFHMVGQWVMPGGGLPSGLMTARVAISEICKHDQVSLTVAS
ncbi:MAG TPA: NAD(P)/FAD-dependent oxidoreductase [Acidobacteriaceae bacterium]|nr:NAD(P)/FAD-dependent oxidoreductase [Acidobacteriaceae bacterium]